MQTRLIDIFGDQAAAASFIGMSALFIFFCMVVLLIIWIALPFSIFGLKSLLKQAVSEQKKTNELLQALLKKERDKEERP